MNDQKEVYYFCYCKRCTHEKLSEHCEPCNTCLTEFTNDYSHKPRYFKEKEDSKHDRSCKRRAADANA